MNPLTWNGILILDLQSNGATNRLIADHSNLMNSSEFYGSDQVHMGNGKGLAIKHVGSSTFSSPFCLL